MLNKDVAQILQKNKQSFFTAYNYNVVLWSSAGLTEARFDTVIHPLSGNHTLGYYLLYTGSAAILNTSISEQTLGRIHPDWAR